MLVLCASSAYVDAHGLPATALRLRSPCCPAHSVSTWTGPRAIRPRRIRVRETPMLAESPDISLYDALIDSFCVAGLIPA